MYQYPYGDSQQLNLDWLMEQWQETKASIDGSLQGEIDRVEAAITDLLTARDQAVAAKTAAETAATAASGYAGTASGAASTATAQATAAAASAALAGSKASDAQTAETNAALQATAAANSAAAAAVSKTNAGNSETAAAASSSAAAGNALYAEGMANGTQNGTPVASGSPYYENNAAYWAGEAQNYDNDAALAAYYSEAMAKGTMNGTPVTSGEPGYEDNAEYYKDQAAAQAAAAAASAASADGTNAQKMIAAPEEATSTASAAHAAGTYFRYNNKLYKATQDIALGGTITPNTNCVEDTVCAELTAQSEQIVTEFNDIRTISIGNNLCNPADIENGYLNSNGTLDTGSAYWTSGLIPVEYGETYFIGEYKSDTHMIRRTRHLGMFYDASMSPISASYVNTDSTDGIAMTVSSADYKYLRGCAHKFTGDILQIEKGDSATYAQQYKETITNKMELPQLDPYKPMEGLAEKKTGTNLFKTSNYSNGLINSSIGDPLDTSGNYYTTDYIPITNGTTYTIAFMDGLGLISASRVNLLCYDADKNPIPSTYSSNATVQSKTITAVSDGYVRISVAQSRFATNTVLVSGTTLPAAFIPYYEYYQMAENTRQSNIGNILQGKKWAACGDSFTASTNATFDSGIYSGKDKTYPYLIALRNDMELLPVFFASGRTLAFPATPGDFANSLTNPSASCYYQNIPADTDYITIMLGTNDSHHEPDSDGDDGEETTGEIPLGTLSDATTATYYGAWNVVIAWLKENRPFAHLGIIVTNGTDRIAYRTAQLEIAQKYGIPYIDLNGDSRTPAMIRAQNTNLPSSYLTILRNTQAIDPDGSITGSVNTHPNYQAHEYESHIIEAFLRTL